MKIFKTQSILTDEIKNSMSIGETVVLRLHDTSPYVQFTVLQCVAEGSFPYQGGFNNLKKAVSFAESIEKPDLINNYYQIVDLAGGQRMMIYYALHEEEVFSYIEAMQYDFTIETPIAESGIKVIFLSPMKSQIQESTEEVQEAKMIAFGNYLLSEERTKLFEDHPQLGNETIKERLSQVHHSDLINFKEFNEYTLKPIPKEWVDNETRQDFIHISDRLPEISDKKSVVEVRVKTKAGGIGDCLFGYSGAMGEPMSGSFSTEITNFKGRLMSGENSVEYWKYK